MNGLTVSASHGSAVKVDNGISALALNKGSYAVVFGNNGTLKLNGVAATAAYCGTVVLGVPFVT